MGFTPILSEALTDNMSTTVKVSPKLELIDLELRYAVPRKRGEGGAGTFVAVDLVGVDHAQPIQIYPAEFTILLGPSGCGKSSLLRMLAGLEQPTKGKVLKDGIEIDGPGKDRGMVFQSYTSFPWLTVEGNVQFALQLRKNSKNKWGKRKTIAEQREKVHSILRLVGLSDSLDKYPKTLSGGMKQRVAIARALVNDPDILLMDEPFGALDPHIRVKMQELVLAIERELRTTILFVTHDAKEAVFLGDTIYISTLCPCFLKYRMVHPFVKEEIPRETAKREYAKDFLLFQREVEDRMQSLIEDPEITRRIEEGDWTAFKRSALGLIEEIDTN